MQGALLYTTIRLMRKERKEEEEGTEHCLNNSRTSYVCSEERESQGQFHMMLSLATCLYWMLKGIFHLYRPDQDLFKPHSRLRNKCTARM